MTKILVKFDFVNALTAKSDCCYNEWAVSIFMAIDLFAFIGIAGQ